MVIEFGITVYAVEESAVVVVIVNVSCGALFTTTEMALLAVANPLSITTKLEPITST